MSRERRTDDNQDKFDHAAEAQDELGHQQPEDAERQEDEIQDVEPEPVEEDVEALRAERDDLRDRLQRLAADYDNYKKRVRRDIEQTREFANEELIKSLLGVLDDMERALAAARNDHDESDPLLKGMQIVHDNALAALGKFGLEPIEAEGKQFNPDRHAAMMQQPSEEHPPQTVLRELQRGYMLKGRTIRPSAVVVSSPAEDAQ